MQAEEAGKAVGTQFMLQHIERVPFELLICQLV